MEHVQIMSKIESLKAVNDLNAIILESDAIMLARGDLGVEIPFQKVPFYQILITNKCKFFGKPIVIATQMLESMAESPRPTRSEATDVYFAASAGADATMLSGESAAGNFPLEAVNAMSLINFEAEKDFNYQNAFQNAYAYVPSVNAEVAYKVAKEVINEKISYVIALSTSGSMIKALSKFRPNARILGVSKDKHLYTYFGA
jgi:pyruvate kinase